MSKNFPAPMSISISFVILKSGSANDKLVGMLHECFSTDIVGNLFMICFMLRNLASKLQLLILEQTLNFTDPLIVVVVFVMPITGILTFSSFKFFFYHFVCNEVRLGT